MWNPMVTTTNEPMCFTYDLYRFVGIIQEFWRKKKKSNSWDRNFVTIDYPPVFLFLSKNSHFQHPQSTITVIIEEFRLVSQIIVLTDLNCFRKRIASAINLSTFFMHNVDIR